MIELDPYSQIGWNQYWEAQRAARVERMLDILARTPGVAWLGDQIVDVMHRRRQDRQELIKVHRQFLAEAAAEYVTLQQLGLEMTQNAAAADVTARPYSSISLHDGFIVDYRPVTPHVDRNRPVRADPHTVAMTLSAERGPYFIKDGRSVEFLWQTEVALMDRAAVALDEVCARAAQQLQ